MVKILNWAHNPIGQIVPAILRYCGEYLHINLFTFKNVHTNFIDINNYFNIVHCI